MKILAEIHRVMAPGGAFVFSTHNRDFQELNSSRSVGRFNFIINPIKLTYRAARFWISSYNSWRLGQEEFDSRVFSVYNDNALDHRLLTYYIGLPQQTKQLYDLKFANVRSFGIDGAELDPACSYKGGYMVHFIAEKK